MRRVMGLIGVMAAVACSAHGGSGPIGTGDGGAPQADAAPQADGPVGVGPDAMAPGDASGGDVCGAFCARAAMASCPAFDAGQCASSCAGVLGVARCRAQAEAAFRCGATANVTCDEDGDATSSDCAAEGMALTACITGSP